MVWGRWVGVALAAVLLGTVAPGGARAQDEPEPNTSPLVCDEYAGDPDPVLERHEWQARDLNNVACATQRQQDATSPAFKSKFLAARQEGLDPHDPFRVPEEWHDAGRGQMRKFTFLGNRGTRMNARLYSPNAGVPGPFPGIAFSPGLQSYNEVNAWFGQDLAEEGYIVLVIDPQGQGESESDCRNPDGSTASCTGHNNLTSAIDFLLHTPDEPHPHAGSRNADDAQVFNPQWERLDRDHIGISGHSLGAINATPVAQTDARVSAVVAYDNLDGTLGATIPRRTPALYFYADYPFPAFSFPMAIPPDESRHMGIFDQLAPAGVDVMSVTSRATTHYEWGYQPWPFSFPASRYGERVASYYTIAWFDRYLKGDASAATRLTAHYFDDSADRHSIGTGTFDPDAWLADPDTPGAGNVPYKIQGKCAANLLSFYYRSAYSLDGGALASDNIRDRGCPPPVGAIDVQIDVKPGEDEPSPINADGNGLVPVAILSTPGFDAAARVYAPALRFGKTGEEDSLAFRHGAPHCTGEDADRDGLDDLVCRFESAKLGYDGDEGDTVAVLTGRTADASPAAIRGHDAVRIQ